MKAIINFLGADNFQKFDLTQSQIQNAAILFSVILVLIFALGKVLFPDEKKLAWVITIANSFLTMLLGVFYLYEKVSHDDRYLTFGDKGHDMFYSQSNVSALLCLWFALANIFDLGLGLIFYRAQLNWLTAYVHHPIYIWIMYACTTGDCGYKQEIPFSATFALTVIEELPTLLLGLGSISSSLRTDIGFGLSFFILRILFHGYVGLYCWFSGGERVLLGIFILTMLMHLNWFGAWVTKYGSKMLKGGKKKGKVENKTV